MIQPTEIPYNLIGGEPAVTRLVARFYALMAETEPTLARLHPCDDQGRVLAEAQERFRLFLIGWLGGPDTYERQYGHPRLRMRHGRVPVDTAMRDAWLHCMNRALDEGGYPAGVTAFLRQRFAEVADFLRNTPD